MNSEDYFNKQIQTTEVFKQKTASVAIKSTGAFPKFEASTIDAASEKAPVGLDSLLKASKKLLAINRGEVDPDERDSMRFKRVYNTDDLIAERVRMDAGKLRNSLMYKLNNIKSLKYFPSGAFDSYATGHIVGSPLSLPSEEVNPIFNLDQQSRVIVFGQGGISSAEAITEDSQNVHPSQFGVIDVVVGPESEKIGVDARLASMTRIGKKDGKLYTMLKDRKTGKKVWMTPDEIEDQIVSFPV